jgi:hypothetical protein
MNKRLAAVVGVLLGCCAANTGQAQQLILNADFETLARDEADMLVRDGHGNAVPVDWYRSANAPPAVPFTELIGPENGDAATDSDGTGEYAVAINTGDLSGHGDWRSAAIPTTPGEELFWSFDFKIADYFDTNPGSPHGSPEGFRVDLRSFESADPSNGNTNNFAGEQQLYVYVHGFGADTNGDGLGDSGGYAVGGSWPHSAASVTVANFNDGQWHTLSSDLFGDADAMDDNNLWKIPSVAGGSSFDGNVTDFRISVNAFNFVFTPEFQLLVDNIAVVRPGSITPTGDYNGDGFVDAADYTIWRDTFGQTVANLGEGADGDLSGMIDEGDYDFWKLNFGTAIPPGGGSLTVGTLVPEPSGVLLALWTLVVVSCRRSKS